MPRKTAKTDIYRLIDAGHLARRALLQPFIDQGLFAGDDAIVLALGEKKSHRLPESQLLDLTGFDRPGLETRLRRLTASGFVAPTTTGDGLTPAIELTNKGKALATSALDHWRRLDAALLGELKPQDRKRLRAILKRLANLLELE